MSTFITLILTSGVLTLATLVIATFCRHRVVVLRYSAPEALTTAHRFIIENAEDVPLQYPVEIEIAITGIGEFAGTPSLLCGHREFAFDDGSRQIDDTFSPTKKSFHFVLPRMRALDTWVVTCHTRAGAILSLTMYGYDPGQQKRTRYFPVIPTEVLARDTESSISAPATPPNVVLALALLAASSGYCVSLWFPPPWVSFRSQEPTGSRLVMGLSEIGRWDILLWFLLVLIVVLCFWAVRQQSQPLIQGYLGWDENVWTEETPSDISPPAGDIPA